MLDSGSGLTFTDADLNSARVVIGLLGRAESFKGLNAQAIMEAAIALKWMEALIPKITGNIFDMSQARLTNPTPEAQPTEAPKIAKPRKAK